MHKFILLVLFSLISISSQQINLPMEVSGVRYSSSISRPEEIISHKIGLRHTRTDQVVDYFEALASQSNRVIVNDHASSHEGRRLIHAIVTHPDNHKKLDAIRLANLSLSDSPNKIKDSDLDNMPMIAYLGFSIHGNEASGTEAAILLLYHLAAGNGKEIDEILKNTV
ncbi:MAG: zinc carboxypeptidase, partial [Candidatus Marinimicrobia bacterium]|nr:zinc carboxypeptidase [Candidatus Neomarinimicrobiota bacterium]